MFDELVLRYRGPLLHAAWSKLGDRLWAEDVVQETYLAAYAARNTFNPEFSFRTWLWTILLNLCRRQWKRRGIHRRDISYDGANSERNATIPEPVTVETGLTKVLGIEQRERILAVLNELPEVQADALRLRFYGGLKFEEIADAMGASVSASKVRVRKGLQNLAKHFREQKYFREQGGEAS